MCDLEWTITPPTMMVGYQGLQDAATLRNISGFYEREFPRQLLGGPNRDFTEEQRTLTKERHPSRDSNKTKVAFISAFFMQHSVGRLMIGVMESMDKTKFELQCYASSRYWNVDEDDIGRRLWEVCDVHDLLPRDREQARAIVVQHKPDVVIYPELGMDAFTYYFSFARLAPVQMVFWGHPISQGVASIDYFISSELFELDSTGKIEPDACNEQRIMMEGMTTIFSRPEVGVVEKEGREDLKEEFGLRGKRLYLCSQTLMKFHLDFDEALLGIIEGDEDGVVVITYNSNQELWKSALERRLTEEGGRRRRERKSARVGEVMFIKALEKEKFYRLLASADVVLDTFPWGGGVTALEAFAAGAVIVSLPSRQHVVKLVSGFYQVMGLDREEGLIAESVDEYVEMALKLGKDIGGVRQKLGALVRERVGLLFDGQGVVQEWEDMLLRVVGESVDD